MKIAILGYGKMGKVIEKIALERGHTITFKISSSNVDEIYQMSPENVDVVIDFSNPDVVFYNLKYCMEKSLKVVCGTTGWLEQKGEIEELCKVNQAGFLYSSNFSIGVNLFFKINEYLAALMAPHQDYEIFTSEIHHIQKLDSPSGTSISVAEGIIKQNPKKKGWVNNKLPDSEQVPIWSSREGTVAGTHTVKYISEIDEIEISHKAFSRSGFAMGAVLAAEWLNGKTGVFGMNDMLQL